MMEFRTPLERRQTSADRKADLRAANRCINGPLFDGPSKRLRIVHGPVVRGGRCQRCIDAREAQS